MKMIRILLRNEIQTIPLGVPNIGEAMMYPNVLLVI